MNLEIVDVGKRWDDVWGLRGVSLDCGPGVLGLVGPNGAGKSTLMQLLTTVTKPTAGTIRWNGTDVVESPNELRSVLGYLPQHFGWYPNLTATEFLRYFATLKGLPRRIAAERVRDLLALTNLDDVGDRKLETFSGGMRQRVGIAQALLNDPELLVVDEPTVGLDPEERVRFRNVLGDLAGDRIVVLSTHIVSDVEATADEIAVLDDGRLLAHTTPEELIERVRGDVWEWTVRPAELQDLMRTHPVTRTTRRNDGLLVRAIADERPDGDATSVRPSLEDAYLSALGSREV